MSGGTDGVSSCWGKACDVMVKRGGPWWRNWPRLNMKYLSVKWSVSFHHSSSDWLLTNSFFAQEPKCKDGSEYFDSRMDNFTTDTLAPSQFSALLWSPGSSHVLSQRSESTNAVSSDALRQNIYENFMRELEMSRTNLENTETSSETEDSSGESLSSLEQLDLLYEKEQGVVRKAGWLFFKPLVTLQKEKKLELVTRRKWKQYWVTLKGKPPRCSFGLAAAVVSIVSQELHACWFLLAGLGGSEIHA